MHGIPCVSVCVVAVADLLVWVGEEAGDVGDGWKSVDEGVHISGDLWRLVRCVVHMCHGLAGLIVDYEIPVEIELRWCHDFED